MPNGKLCSTGLNIRYLCADHDEYGVSCSLVLHARAHMHEHAHTCTHARAHAHTRAHTHTHTHTYARAHARTHMHEHAHTCTHARAHAHTRTHTHTHAHTHMHARTHARAHIPAHTHKPQHPVPMQRLEWNRALEERNLQEAMGKGVPARQCICKQVCAKSSGSALGLLPKLSILGVVSLHRVWIFLYLIGQV